MSKTDQGKSMVVLGINPAKVLDLLTGKQTQYYGLWAVYTAVQFSAGSFGMSIPLTPAIAMAVVLAVWAFNIGHLGFLLACARQISDLHKALVASIAGDDAAFNLHLTKALDGINDTAVAVWALFRAGVRRREFFWPCFVHIFIDVCASIGLLVRVAWHE